VEEAVHLSRLTPLSFIERTAAAFPRQSPDVVRAAPTSGA
jgi:hypothetical protein